MDHPKRGGGSKGQKIAPAEGATNPATCGQLDVSCVMLKIRIELAGIPAHGVEP